MKRNDVLKVLGVAAVAVIGYYYYMSLDDYDEYFDEDYDDGSDLRCSEYTPYACSQEGEVMFRDPYGNDVEITEECCNDLGFTFGGNASTGKNACLCDTPGQDITDFVRPT